MAPAFSITAILTLALGIGATTAIFTLVYAVLLKSLAVANPQELYRLGKEVALLLLGRIQPGQRIFADLLRAVQTLPGQHQRFCGIGGVPGRGHLFGVRRAGSAEAAQSYPGKFVSGNYFAMFGVGAYAGRVLRTEDDQTGAPPTAVMSYRLWQQKYGSDPSVIGSVFNLNDKPFTVVGITPPAFFGDQLRNNPPDFFMPLATEPLMEEETTLFGRDQYWLDLIGRIRPGGSPRP